MFYDLIQVYQWEAKIKGPVRINYISFNLDYNGYSNVFLIRRHLERDIK
jgi:hypothetical protein